MQSQSVKIVDNDGCQDFTGGDDVYDRFLNTTESESAQTIQGPTAVTAGLCIEATEDVTIDLQVITTALNEFMDNIARATVKWSF